MSTVVIPYTIPANTAAFADHNVLDLGSRSIVGVRWPDALTNTTITFRSRFQTGVFRPLAMGGSITTFTASVGDLETFNNSQVRAFRVMQLLIITTAALEAEDRVFQIIARHVG